MSTPNSFNDHAWWLASRAAGVTALILVTISVVLGLMMAGKVSKRPGIGPVLRAIHEQTALLGLVAIAVHGLTLLGDHWLNPGPAGIVIPFAMSYRPMWTGFGIIAGWTAAILGLSFYARKRIGARLWRKAHRFTIAVYALGVVHTLGAGTDAASPWLFWPVVASVPLVTGLFGARVVHGIQLSRRRAAARKRLDDGEHPARRRRTRPPRTIEEAA